MISPDFHHVDALLQSAVPDTAPAAQLTIRWRGAPIFERCYGWLDPETRQHPTQPDTLFDLASVTKLFVVTALMTLVEEGRIGLDSPVATVLPELSGERPVQPYEDPLQTGGFVQIVESAPPVDVGQITFRHLITHTAGLPAWRPLFRQGSPEAARQMALTTACAYPIGTTIVYSDIGLILTGMSIERMTNMPLDEAVRARVTAPLGLTQTQYLPASAESKPPNVAPTEICAWRGRRVAGEVHDENAAGLGGIAGHAGLFSTSAEVARFGQMFLDEGAPLLRPETVAEMVRLQAEAGAVRRGLGFALWSPDADASSNPLSQHAFGHLGFTGTSLWMDPERELVIALLTNDVYHGRASRGIGTLRVALHRAVVEALP